MSTEFVARSYNTNQTSPAQYIWTHTRRHPLVGFLMVFGAFANGALASLVPYLLGVAFNAILNGNDLQIAGRMAFWIVVSQVTRGALQLIRNFSAEVFAQRVERDVRDELYGSLLGKDMSYHNLQPVGEIMARVTNDVRELNFFFNPGLNLVVGSSMFLLIPLAVSPTIHPALILTPALFILGYIIVQYYYVRSVYEVAQHVRASFGQMNARLAEALDGIEVVKGASQEAQEIATFEGLVGRVRDFFVRQGDVEARYLALLLQGIAMTGGFLHSVYLFQNGQINAGDIVNYIGQLSLFGFPVFSSLFSLARIGSGYAGADRILKVINAETYLDQNEAGHSAPIRGDVAFEKVTFGYLDEPVIHEVSFSVKAGQTAAIVGQTGAGKTTLTTLVNRIHEPGGGRVLIDGVDTREWNLESLRSQISIIEQEIFLFSRTIAENIAYGKLEATPAEIEMAAKKAQAHDFIMSFPEGYKTVIGQRGVTLSGGQRQRIAIARAFLTDPQILVLDDSTSAIDSATEDKIQQAIWEAAKGRTTILITHRLSQIRWADHIIVLRQGRVAAQGTHEDLLRSSEAYRRIFARYESATTRIDADLVKSLIDETKQGK
jgi:ATP-binding cassette subfamily B protein